MLTVIMLSVIMLSVIMLNIVILSVVVLLGQIVYQGVGLKYKGKLLTPPHILV
jgi:hypothetical protein